MKSIVSVGIVGLSMLTVGFVAGQHSSIKSATATIQPDQAIAAVDADIQTATQPPAAKNKSPSPASFLIDEDEIDIIARLKSPQASDRQDALYIIWRKQIADRHQSEIEAIADEDMDSRTASFAQWILGIAPDMEASGPSRPEFILTDFSSPDKQLKSTLIANTTQYQQANQRPQEDRRPSQEIQSLPEEEQLAYIKKLTESQDDAAVSELNELVLHYNPILKDAAIEGLLSLLEMRTGHFDAIARGLEQNMVYLNDDQIRKFRQLTQDGNSSSNQAIPEQ